MKSCISSLNQLIFVDGEREYPLYRIYIKHQQHYGLHFDLLSLSHLILVPDSVQQNAISIFSCCISTSQYYYFRSAQNIITLNVCKVYQ